MSDFLNEANRIADEMEFNFPSKHIPIDSLSKCYAVLPATEARSIERAAFSAHQDKHKVAEQWRIEGGYGGLAE